MKKKFFTLLGCTAIAVSLSAQIQLIDKAIDMSVDGKKPNGRLVNSVINPSTGETAINFVEVVTNVASKGGFESVTYSFGGLKYNFDKMVLDKDLNFVRMDKDHAENTFEAASKYPIYGPGFTLNPDSKYILTQGPNSSKGSSITKSEWQVKLILTTASKWRGGGPAATDYLTTKKVENFPLVDAAGKRVGMVYNSSTLDGIRIIASDGQPNTKLTAQYYNQDFKVVNEASFNVDYAHALSGHPFFTESGSEDVAVLIQPTKKQSGLNFKDDALAFEYIRLDGKTMQTKNRVSIPSNNTEWLVDKVIEKDGSVYLMGPISNKKEHMTWYYGLIIFMEGIKFSNYLNKDADNFPNYQIVKISNGKVDYVSTISIADMKAIATTVEGTKGKIDPTTMFRYHDVEVVNGNIFLAVQNNEVKKGIDERREVVTIQIDATGKLIAYHAVPKENYAHTQLFVSENKEHIYWSIFDYSDKEIQAIAPQPMGTLNWFINRGDDHRILKNKNNTGCTLELVKLNIANKTASALQVCGKDEYSLLDDNQILYENNKEVVFFGTSGEKKDVKLRLIKMKLD